MKKTITVRFFREKKTNAIATQKYKLLRYVKYFNETHKELTITEDDIEEIVEKREIDIDIN